MSAAQTQARIRSPLDRLRGFIRTYVTLEGAALGVLFLAAWFWIGLGLDYGLFKLTGADLVQYDESRIFRLVVLVGLVGGLLALLAVTIIARLVVQFSDIAVALVLEKRFPTLLGDRLITAVELNDPQEAAKHGYSAAMVQQTIDEAAQQVEKVPVKEAFDWGRLFKRGAFILAGTVGLYLLAAAGFAVARAASREGSPMEGVSDLNDVSATWVERNIFLQNTIWPRRSHLEIVSPADDLRIPKKSRPGQLVVRAWKYVVADGSLKEGWRQMLWTKDDLQKASVPAGGVPDLPKEWTPREGMRAVTVDEVDLRLAAFPIRKRDGKWMMPTGNEDEWRAAAWGDLRKERLDGLDVSKAFPEETTLDEAEKALGGEEAKLADARTALERVRRLGDLRDALDSLDGNLGGRAMRRTARKLVVPGTVRLSWWNRSTTTGSDLVSEEDNLFTGNWNDLEETTHYKVSGEDYVTPTRTIQTVERPLVETLTSEEERPAYLSYRPGRDGASPTGRELSGKRQKFAPYSLPVAGEFTKFEVPMGTSVTLAVTTTKPIRKDTVELVPDLTAKKGLAKFELRQTGDRSFTCRLPDIRRPQLFTFKFIDEDNVPAERKIEIVPRADLAPTVREFNPDDAIRRDKGVFLVSAKARIPFRARVRDDNGLGSLRYGCKVTLAADKGTNAIDLLGMVPLFGAVPAVVRASASATPEQMIDVRAFEQALLANRQPDDPAPNEGKREFVGTDLSLKRLDQAMTLPFRKLLNEFVLGADDWTRNDKNADPWKKGADGKETLDTQNLWLKARDPDAPLGGDLGVWQLRWTDAEGKKHELEEKDEAKAQKRYVIEARLLAEDTYLEGETDPRTGDPRPNLTPSSETFLFVVVTENELLAEIGKDEELKYRDLARSFKPLDENRQRVSEMSAALPTGMTPTDVLAGWQARCESLGELLKTSQADAKSAYDAYEKIVREMRLNQISADYLHKVLQIHKPLKDVDALFSRASTSVGELRAKLAEAAATTKDRTDAANRAKDDLNELHKVTENILRLMEGLIDLKKMIEQLIELERKEEALGKTLAEVQRRLLIDLLKEKKE
ncbi:MAG: hypothetical protein K2W96_20715 [Gemmataceae bacterium]|nr:hypothetical protein [Gemmataceae bacterium]